MMYRKLWLGTAFVGLMISASSPVRAQEYFNTVKRADQPAAEAPAEAPVEDSADTVAPVVKKHSTAKTKKAAAVQESGQSSDDLNRAALDATKTSASPVDAALAPAPISSPVPAPAPVPHAAPAAVVQQGGSIISQPPAMDAAPSAAPEYRGLGGATPIISNPPDTVLRPPPRYDVLSPVPSPVPYHEMSAMPSSEPVPAPKPVLKPVPAPAHMAAPARAPKPAPQTARRPSLIQTPAEPPRAMPRDTVEDRPLAAPLPDIKVVHESDNPEVSEPAPVAQPAPHKVSEEPPMIPKTGKIGKTTAPMLVPAPDLHEHVETPATPPAATTPDVASEPAITPPIAAPADLPAEDVTSTVTDTMPVVPTIADLTLGFSGNSSDLSPEAQKKLDSVIRQMKEMTDGRLQVRGFATGEDGSTSSARRIALSRALSVRSYLMDKGIKPTRVDVRAMGTDTERSPLDRVDLLFVR